MENERKGEMINNMTNKKDGEVDVIQEMHMDRGLCEEDGRDGVYVSMSG